MVVLDFNSSNSSKPLKKVRYQRYSAKKLKERFPHLNRNDLELVPSLRVFGRLDTASLWLILQDPLTRSKYKRHINLLLYGLIYVVTYRSRSVRFVSSFFTDNLRFYKGFKANNFQPYYSNLAEFPLSRRFVFPHDFCFLPTKLYYGTRSKKRLTRLKYRDSVYYNEWVGLQKTRITSFYRFSTFKKPYLDKIRKVWETTVSNFNPIIFSPSTLHDALCYFFIYGPPSKTCKDKKKIRLFFTVFLSGLYFDRKSSSSVANMLFERRLFLSQFQEEEIAANSENINELRFVFPNDSIFKLKGRIWLRKAQILQRRVVHSIRKLVIHNINKIGTRVYLFYGYWIRYIKEQLGYFFDIIELLWREITPFFIPNPVSFVWSLMPYTVEYWLARVYIFSVETFYEGRQFFYYDDDTETHSISNGLYNDIFEYYFITQWLDVWFDYIVYYTHRIINPVRELFLEFPFWTILNYGMAAYAHGGTLINNGWYNILTFRNTEDKVRGRWYKIPLILIRWIFHWILFFTFIFFFLFYIDYKDVGYYLAYIIPFSPYLHSVHTTYIIVIVLMGFRFFGPYSLQELMRVDMAWDGWICVLYANLITMLDLAPYVMPNTVWGSSDLIIGLNRDQLVVFSFDKPAPVIYGYPLEYAQRTVKMENYYVESHRFEFDGPLYGEDSKTVAIIRDRRL